jgi:hypothetical protein
MVAPAFFRAGYFLFVCCLVVSFLRAGGTPGRVEYIVVAKAGPADRAAVSTVAANIVFIFFISVGSLSRIVRYRIPLRPLVLTALPRRFPYRRSGGARLLFSLRHPSPLCSLPLTSLLRARAGKVTPHSARTPPAHPEACGRRAGCTRARGSGTPGAGDRVGCYPSLRGEGKK